jgi:hypothetical protein
MIGNATFQLGIELEINVVILESIERSHKELTNQTRAMLKEWKSEKCSNPFKALAKSLQRVQKSSSIEVLKCWFDENQVDNAITNVRDNTKLSR